MAMVHRRHLSRSVRDVLLPEPFECASELRVSVDCYVPIPGPPATASSGQAAGKR